MALFLLDNLFMTAPWTAAKGVQRLSFFPERWLKGYRGETLIGRLVDVWRQVRPLAANDSLSQAWT